MIESNAQELCSHIIPLWPFGSMTILGTCCAEVSVVEEEDAVVAVKLAFCFLLFLLLSALEAYAVEDRLVDEVDEVAVADVVVCFLLLFMSGSARAVVEEQDVVVVEDVVEAGL
jgi:hypothetical protein